MQLVSTDLAPHFDTLDAEVVGADAFKKLLPVVSSAKIPNLAPLQLSSTNASFEVAFEPSPPDPSRTADFFDVLRDRLMHMSRLRFVRKQSRKGRRKAKARDGTDGEGIPDHTLTQGIGKHLDAQVDRACNVGLLLSMLLAVPLVLGLICWAFHLEYTVAAVASLAAVGAVLRVYFFSKPPPKKAQLPMMQIFVRDPHAKTHTVDVALSDTLEVVKAKIKKKTNMKMDFYFSSEGKVLDDKRTLGSYGVRKQSTLYMSVRLRGGVRSGDGSSSGGGRLDTYFSFGDKIYRTTESKVDDLANLLVAGDCGKCTVEVDNDKFKRYKRSTGGDVWVFEEVKGIEVGGLRELLEEFPLAQDKKDLALSWFCNNDIFTIELLTRNKLFIESFLENLEFNKNSPMLKLLRDHLSNYQQHKAKRKKIPENAAVMEVVEVELEDRIPELVKKVDKLMQEEFQDLYKTISKNANPCDHIHHVLNALRDKKMQDAVLVNGAFQMGKTNMMLLYAVINYLLVTKLLKGQHKAWTFVLAGQKNWAEEMITKFKDKCAMQGPKDGGGGVQFEQGGSGIDSDDEEHVDAEVHEALARLLPEIPMIFLSGKKDLDAAESVASQGGIVFLFRGHTNIDYGIELRKRMAKKDYRFLAAIDEADFCLGSTNVGCTVDDLKGKDRKSGNVTKKAPEFEKSLMKLLCMSSIKQAQQNRCFLSVWVSATNLPTFVYILPRWFTKMINLVDVVGFKQRRSEEYRGFGAMQKYLGQYFEVPKAAEFKDCCKVTEQCLAMVHDLAKTVGGAMLYSVGVHTSDNTQGDYASFQLQQAMMDVSLISRRRATASIHLCGKDPIPVTGGVGCWSHVSIHGNGTTFSGCLGHRVCSHNDPLGVQWMEHIEHIYRFYLRKAKQELKRRAKLPDTSADKEKQTFLVDDLTGSLSRIRKKIAYLKSVQESHDTQIQEAIQSARKMEAKKAELEQAKARLEAANQRQRDDSGGTDMRPQLRDLVKDLEKQFEEFRGYHSEDCATLARWMQNRFMKDGHKVDGYSALYLDAEDYQPLMTIWETMVAKQREEDGASPYICKITAPDAAARRAAGAVKRPVSKIKCDKAVTFYSFLRGLNILTEQIPDLEAWRTPYKDIPMVLCGAGMVKRSSSMVGIDEILGEGSMTLTHVVLHSNDAGVGIAQRMARLCTTLIMQGCDTVKVLATESAWLCALASHHFNNMPEWNPEHTTMEERQGRLDRLYADMTGGDDRPIPEHIYELFESTSRSLKHTDLSVKNGLESPDAQRMAWAFGNNIELPDSCRKFVKEIPNAFFSASNGCGLTFFTYIASSITRVLNLSGAARSQFVRAATAVQRPSGKGRQPHVARFEDLVLKAMEAMGLSGSPDRPGVFAFQADICDFIRDSMPTELEDHLNDVDGNVHRKIFYQWEDASGKRRTPNGISRDLQNFSDKDAPIKFWKGSQKGPKDPENPTENNIYWLVNSDTPIPMGKYIPQTGLVVTSSAAGPSAAGPSAAGPSAGRTPVQSDSEQNVNVVRFRLEDELWKQGADKSLASEENLHIYEVVTGGIKEVVFQLCDGDGDVFNSEQQVLHYLLNFDKQKKRSRPVSQEPRKRARVKKVESSSSDED